MPLFKRGKEYHSRIHVSVPNSGAGATGNRKESLTQNMKQVIIPEVVNTSSKEIHVEPADKQKSPGGNSNDNNFDARRFDAEFGDLDEVLQNYDFDKEFSDIDEVLAIVEVNIPAPSYSNDVNSKEETEFKSCVNTSTKPSANMILTPDFHNHLVQGNSLNNLNNEEISALKLKTKVLLNQIQEKDGALKLLRSRLSNTERELLDTRSKLHAKLSRELKAEQADADRMRREIESLKAERDAQEQEMLEMDKQRKSIHKALDAERKKCREMEQQVQTLKICASSNRTSKDKIQAEIEEIENQFSQISQPLTGRSEFSKSKNVAEHDSLESDTPIEIAQSFNHPSMREIRSNIEFVRFLMFATSNQFCLSSPYLEYI